MTNEEAARVLGDRSGEAVRALVAQARGWPAVIGLAALAGRPTSPSERVPGRALPLLRRGGATRQQPPELQRFPAGGVDPACGQRPLGPRGPRRRGAREPDRAPGRARVSSTRADRGDVPAPSAAPRLPAAQARGRGPRARGLPRPGPASATRRSGASGRRRSRSRTAPATSTRPRRSWSSRRRICCARGAPRRWRNGSGSAGSSVEPPPRRAAHQGRAADPAGPPTGGAGSRPGRGGPHRRRRSEGVAALWLAGRAAHFLSATEDALAFHLRARETALRCAGAG